MFQVRGAIGKQFVMKRYGNKTVVTRYPDMSGIVPSTKQKVRRRLFARAVRYAQSIYWKGELKAEWKRKLRRPRRLFQALMKQYYRQLARKREQNEGRIQKWQRNVVAHGDLMLNLPQLPPFPAYAIGNKKEKERRPNNHFIRKGKQCGRFLHNL